MSKRIQSKNLIIDFLEVFKPKMSEEDRHLVAKSYIDNKQGSKSGMLAQKANALMSVEDKICYAHGKGMMEVIEEINKVIQEDGEKYSDGEVIDYIYYLIN